MAKVKVMLGSVRFWMVLVGAVVYLLGNYEVIPVEIVNAIEVFLGTSVSVRTADRLFTK